jgi:methyl-accepting chemotaxis protein
MLTFWWEMWRAFWLRPEPKPIQKPLCNLDDFAIALDEYLASSREVADRAARNVEEATLLRVALEESIEDGQRLQAALEDLKERKRQASQAQCDSPPPQARR